MNAIRENMFLVITASVTLVLVLVLGGWGYLNSSALDDEDMKPRQKAISEMKRYARRAKNNPDTNKAAEQRSKDVKSKVRELGTQAADWNKAQFAIPLLETNRGDKRAAFPFEREAWKNSLLFGRFLIWTHSTLDSQLAMLHPVQSLTVKEVEKEARKIQVRLNAVRLMQEKTHEGRNQPAGQEPAGMPGELIPGGPEMIPGGAGMAPVGGVGQGELDMRAGSRGYSPKALAEAIQNMLLEKSQTGWMVVDWDALAKEFGKEAYLDDNTPADKIWRAALICWIQDDIVKAIRQTVEQDFTSRKLPNNKKNIIYSPIKKLVKIYFPQSKQDKRPTGVIMPAGPEEMGMLEPGMAMDEPMGVGKTKLQSSLTGLTDNPLYDVVNYEAVLLMDTRVVDRLMENLTKPNYQVVQNLEVLKKCQLPGEGKTVMIPSLEKKTKRVGSGRALDDAVLKEKRYYGTEALRLVRIVGQVKLLTSWTRGSRDQATKKWIHDYPPLMPVDALKQLPPEALRPVDAKRVSGEIKDPPAYVKPKPPALPNKAPKASPKGGAKTKGGLPAKVAKKR